MKHNIPVAFENTWVLATIASPNQIVHLCSEASLTCGLQATSSILGISAKEETAEAKEALFRGVEKAIHKGQLHLFGSVHFSSLALHPQMHKEASVPES